MIDHYALINEETNFVDNIVLWDGESDWMPPGGFNPVNISSIFPQPQIGWTYAAGIFTPPAVPIPTVNPSSTIILASYNSSLQRQAAKFNAHGNTAQAMALYLKAVGIPI